MVSAAWLLLRLPPSLRLHLVSQEHSIKRSLQSRTFASNSKPARRSKAIPTIPPASQSRVPQRSSPKTVAASPSPAPAPRIASAFIESYEPASEKVLLYASPKHGSFFASSYLIGGLLILGGYNYAQMFLKDRPEQRTPWLLKGATTISTIFVVGFGTVLLLAPRKMIKSISIVSSQASGQAATQGSRVLRFEIKRALPFLKTDVLETSPKRVSLDRDVPMAVQDLNFHNVPPGEVQRFTEKYFTPAQAERNSIRATLASFNKSLMNTWPAMKRETRRMFLRDQMVYIDVEDNGIFKLDLQHCYMLDMGRPLHRIIKSNAYAGPNLWRWLSRSFSSNAGK